MAGVAVSDVSSLPHRYTPKTGCGGERICSGGRQAFLYACHTNSIDAAGELWGGRVVMSKEELNPKQPVALALREAAVARM